MVRATDVFKDVSNPDTKVKEAKTWLGTKGVRDFEPVSLFCDQLGKVGAFMRLDESLLTSFTSRLGYREGNRKSCRCSDEQQVADRVQEGYRQGHPQTSGIEAVACSLSPSKPTLHSRRPCDDGPRLRKRSPFVQRRRSRYELQVYGCNLGCTFHVWHYAG